MENGLVKNGMMELEVGIYGSNRTEKARIKYGGDYEKCHKCHNSFAVESTTEKSTTYEHHMLVYLFDREGYASCAGECYDHVIKQVTFPSFFVVSVDELSKIAEHQKKIKQIMQEKPDISDRVTEPAKQPSQA